MTLIGESRFTRDVAERALGLREEIATKSHSLAAHEFPHTAAVRRPESAGQMCRMDMDRLSQVREA